MDRIDSVLLCPVCRRYGGLQFVRTTGGRVVLQCDECLSIFADPAAASYSNNMLPPEVTQPATADMIREAGWENYILRTA